MSLTEEIQKNRESYLSGKLNYVPFNDLGKFTQLFPGTMRGDVTCITGSTSVSKTGLSRYLIEHSAIPWAINNKKNVHVIRFGLEETPIQYDFTLLSYRIFKNIGVEYNLRDFLAIGRTVEEAHLPDIKKAEDQVKMMKKYVTYESNVFNSYGFWKHTRNFAANRGKFYLKGKEVGIEGTGIESGWDEYRPNDPDEFVIVIVDNLSYVTKQKDEKDQSEAIWNTVENLRKFAANKLNYCVYFVQHQNSESENQESRKDKLILPTESGLAINKQVARGYLNLIGVANPNKVNTSGVDTPLRNWDGHDLKLWGNYLRTVNILKSRWGNTNENASIFNAGRSGYFSEIPKGGTIEYKNFIDNLKNFK